MTGSIRHARSLSVTLTVALVAAVIGAGWSNLTVQSAGASIAPITPARLLDTRPDANTIDGQARRQGLRPAGSVTEVPVNNRGGVSGDASSVMLSVIAVQPEAPGFLTVFPCGSPLPAASTVNYYAGEVVSNATLAKVGPGGKVCIYTSAAAHLVADVTAYVPGAGNVVAVDPARLIDTRPDGAPTIDGQYRGIGAPAGGSALELRVAGRGGVAPDATAVLLNVAAVSGGELGFVTVYPCGAELPTSSNVNYLTNTVVSNLVVAKIGVNGAVCVFVSSGVHIVADVSGYVPAGGTLAAMQPARLLDSRIADNAPTIDARFQNIGTMRAGNTVALPVTARGGVAGEATAVVLNVIAVSSFDSGFLTVFPCGTPMPLASSVNYERFEVTSNAVLARVGDDGKVCIYSSATTELVVDATAFLSNDGTGGGSTSPLPPGQQPARGADPVGSASYPIPAGALFVDPAAGNDGAAGTQAAPLRTAVRAVAVAGNGRTIVLRGGTYHETVDIPANKRVTIQPYPGEAVWFDGSRAVGGWSQSGSTWSAPWNVSFPHNASFSPTAHEPAFVNPAFPMAPYPDQVFVDGTALQQVGSAGQVTAGTFYVDEGGDRLVIGTNPAGRDVQASALQKAFNINGHGSVLQGFGVQRYATPLSGLGAVRAAGDDIVLRNLTIRDNASLGISIRGNRTLVDRVTVTRTGMLGVHGNNADGTRVTNSIINNNNSENFNPAPSASGLKITRSRNVSLINNQANNNRGFGLWLDESVVGFTIAGNEVLDNVTAGIMTEISDTGVIANNTSIGNREGIWVYDTGNVKIYNNLLGGSAKQDLLLKQDQRRQANPSFAGHDSRYPIPDPSVPWLLRNITVANNIFANGGAHLMWAQDITNTIDPDSMNITFTGNYLSRRATSGDPRPLVWANAGTTTLTYFDSASQMRTHNGAWVNIDAASSYDANQMISTAPHGSAAPIPGDVAAAVGIATGTQRIGTF